MVDSNDISRSQQIGHSTDKSNRARERKRKLKASRCYIAPAPVYSLVNGFRHVKPYIYEYRTFAKERWFNKSLIEILEKEFGANSPEYYISAIQSGRITVNNFLTTPDTKLKNADYIVHKMHRHEPPVLGNPIVVTYEDDDVLVVSKPSSIPTHPCGAYRHNSLHSILKHERPDLDELLIIHRLDRLTSGLVLFAKNPNKARELSQCIASHQAKKTYFARVRGHISANFGKDLQDSMLQCAKRKTPASELRFEGNSIRISCPLVCVSPKDGVYECSEDGKEAVTEIQVVRNSLDEQTTLLFCRPVTGRTHQIRLHLQLIGFPIANDPCYGGVLHYGDRTDRLVEIKETQEVIESMGAPLCDSSTENFSFEHSNILLSQSPQEGETEDDFMIRTCARCWNEKFQHDETLLRSYNIWLHAWKYELNDKIYSVQEPVWAIESWKQEL